MLCPICLHEAESHSELGCCHVLANGDGCECAQPVSQIVAEPAETKEPESLMDVFEQSDEQGKVGMYAEALSNISQLEGFIDEKDGLIAGLVNDVSNLETVETELLDACNSLMAVINEMKAGVIGQEKEWQDCIALATDAIAKVKGEVVPS